jgi:hypothetical protein
MSTVLNLVAYHGDPGIKKSMLLQVQRHYDADEIQHGFYWRDGKGCALGCMTHTAERAHAALEKMIGVPQWCGYLVDGIFEGLPNADAKEWPLQFINAVPVGFTDWDNLRHDFLEWLLVDKDHGVINYVADEFPAVQAAIREVAELHRIRCTDKEKASASAARAARAASADWAARKAQSEKLLALLTEAGK